MGLIKELVKKRALGWDTFNKLNPDGRVELRPWGYDKETQRLTMQMYFCDKPRGEPLPIESEDCGIQAIYYAHKWVQEQFSSRYHHDIPSYELRINSLNDKAHATLLVNNKWKRISHKLALSILNSDAIRVRHSNCEAYISDMKYIDWFDLVFDEEYFIGEDDVRQTDTAASD